MNIPLISAAIFLSSALAGIDAHAQWCISSADGNEKPNRINIQAPLQAARAGFNLQTFYLSAFAPNNNHPGTKRKNECALYLWQLFKYKASPESILFNTDSSISVRSKMYNGSLTSGTVDADSGKFLGMAFGGGGYFEAELAFSPADVLRDKTGWPAWWATALEPIIRSKRSYWQEMGPEFRRAYEFDFFEFMPLSQGRLDAYSAGMHLWYGTPGLCGGERLCDHRPPDRDSVRVVGPEHQWNEFHKYGALWQVATSTAAGGISFFVDNKPVGKAITWNNLWDQEKLPERGDSGPFKGADFMRFILALGSGPDSPLRIREISVWQRDSVGNISCPKPCLPK